MVETCVRTPKTYRMLRRPVIYDRFDILGPKKCDLGNIGGGVLYCFTNCGVFRWTQRQWASLDLTWWFPQQSKIPAHEGLKNSCSLAPVKDQGALTTAATDTWTCVKHVSEFRHAKTSLEWRRIQDTTLEVYMTHFAFWVSMSAGFRGPAGSCFERHAEEHETCTV